MTWSRLLSLCAAARRPLVVVDFETSGLGGAPPIEYAVAYYAPWQPPEQDPTTTRARGLCPPGLTYASTGRLNPGRKIDLEAQAVHGISDADVAKCMRYDDLAGVAGVFQALAVGDVSAGEGPAVWVGHNAAEADVPWAQAWRYLPAGPLDVVDTVRLSRRLTAAHPMPLAPDAASWSHCPAVRHGLTPYNGKLAGLHTALFGDPADGSHGALADVCATARCLQGVLDLWAPLWPHGVNGEDPAAALTLLLAALDAPPPGVLSWDGWVKGVGAGATWARGKHRGKALRVDLSYASWVSSLPSSPTGRDGEAWCSDATRAALGAK